MKASMKVNLILAAGLAFAVSAVAAQTDNNEAATGRADSAITSPKNLARQHLGANILVYDATSQTYAPTEAAAAWLDDDIATGWPALTGKQDYLLALPEPALVNNFFISARSVTGTITLYAGDELGNIGSLCITGFTPWWFPLKAYSNGFAVFEDPPVLQKNGEFNMPQGPGLGVSINKDMIIS